MNIYYIQLLIYVAFSIQLITKNHNNSKNEAVVILGLAPYIVDPPKCNLSLNVNMLRLQYKVSTYYIYVN
jgi:hypothetical protein